MKQKNLDPRHKRRQQAVKSLFAFSFNAIAHRKTTRPCYKLARLVIKKQKDIDKIIAKSAPKWPIERINKIDLAILRLSIWELCCQRKEPPKVIIDEAVELAKEFGGEQSSSFVNGVLGTVLKTYEKNN